jgi:hypothetical protein
MSVQSVKLFFHMNVHKKHSDATLLCTDLQNILQLKYVTEFMWPLLQNQAVS